MDDADLTGRAHAFVDAINLWNMTLEQLVSLFVAFAQSEREAAAAEIVELIEATARQWTSGEAEQAAFKCAADLARALASPAPREET